MAGLLGIGAVLMLGVAMRSAVAAGTQVPSLFPEGRHLFYCLV
jgi:hypothetical protein